MAPQPVRRLLTRQGTALFALAREIVEAAPAALERGVRLDATPLSVVPITALCLTRLGLPAKAVEWVTSDYGWEPTSRGWQGGFLPLQVVGIARGICDREEGLFQSGITAAPTSAGRACRRL